MRRHPGATSALPPVFTSSDLLDRRPLRLAHRRATTSASDPGAPAHVLRVDTVTHGRTAGRAHGASPGPPLVRDATRCGSRRPSSTRSTLRGFFDGNGDGSGDFRGLIEKLDYLQWLGVDCIWLLPFYASRRCATAATTSPTSTTIHPDYGTIDDVRDFIEAAHQRGIRVIADLVMNHTSSRPPVVPGVAREPRQAPERDWYVWSDTVAPLRGRADHLHRHRDVELDLGRATRGAYYWHRFFSHQPDLNFDNPEVQEAMLEVLRFWLTSAWTASASTPCPYLYEREGTNGENLPETHAFLKRVRARSTRNYPDRVLLAEANQWPADVVEYFGDGDECHMAFHFPVMPRMFMALRREEATPMYEILGRTPDIPRQLPVGPVPAQPRRADARDGHRRGARLHVRASTPRTRG